MKSRKLFLIVAFIFFLNLNFNDMSLIKFLNLICVPATLVAVTLEYISKKRQ
ncbi:putative membrane protein [[Clostridium] bifermentans ATCC 638]|uniref:Putative membrane protein n=1 Tax=Paraclostridium bifermentans ATCC 638 = DSM 14991 TaxID=1233171 RepID=T4VGR8_PARBF|nr:hypothetical protein [Paraclostridium bifermentans]EQK39961.1 putative membrane protein [[Clostridium] bifermentans ATCC 638] [Paraclostridium bifermentans ATCC 638 = DSM 14991]UAG19960.1 hypothetical protein KXZ80_16920 [Paraclostridium bifermentans]